MWVWIFNRFCQIFCYLLAFLYMICLDLLASQAFIGCPLFKRSLFYWLSFIESSLFYWLSFI
uniref:Putative ovule protein n=1 Tax=Solanum chacoense TaxID=4108 RepID=A0A0V0HAM1_SOLCH